MSFLDNPLASPVSPVPLGLTTLRKPKDSLKVLQYHFESVLQGKEVMKTQWLDVLLPEKCR